MIVRKLDNSHAEAIKPLFTKHRFMGVDTRSNLFMEQDAEFLKMAYDGFCNTYISGLTNYHAYGSFDESNNITGYISFYESVEAPEWFGTQFRALPNTKAIPVILDDVIKHNEANGRLKFFSLFNKKYLRGIRSFAFSDWANERYDSFDEYYVEAKHKCLFLTHWQILFNRTLVPTDSVVRCTFLKNKYRKTLFNGGNL